MFQKHKLKKQIIEKFSNGKKTIMNILLIGYEATDFPRKRLSKYKSKFFSFNIIKETYRNIHVKPSSEKTLLLTYSKDDLLNACLEKSTANEMCIAIINQKVDGGSYGSALDYDERFFYLSFYGTRRILRENNIGVFNFILNAAYRNFLRYKCKNNLMHDDIYGCIFDKCMDDYINYIALSASKASICDFCKKKITPLLCERTGLESFEANNIINRIEKELKIVKMTPYFRLQKWVYENPKRIKFMLGLSALASFILGALASLLIAFLVR